jgi:acylphosphatase
MVKHFNIRITGTVQGVFFRANTQKEAEKLGLKGFVMNREDGSVYIEAEGEEQDLNLLVKWCHKGPEKAEVKSVHIEEASLKKFNDFHQKR